MIKFNEPAHFQNKFDLVPVSGDGEYTKKCHAWFEDRFNIKKVLLTTSCTHALEMAAILLDIQPGDEVIMPSYTFVSTANAFILRGAKIVFVDVRPDTMNIDETLIEAAITPKTKLIVPVHYAGVACEMDEIMRLAKQYHLYVVEDAAQAVMSTYKGKPLGSIGDIGCFSFHETKNYSMGEGGAILINNQAHVKRAEIIREKGTNRAQFLNGEIDKYSWVDLGSSYLPSDILAYYLWCQLQEADEINEKRKTLWRCYQKHLTPLSEKGVIDLPSLPENCEHNAHLFYIKCQHFEERVALIEHLKKHDVHAVFHYVPLHSAAYGLLASRFVGEDVCTTQDSERLLRLPLHLYLTLDDVLRVCELIALFYSNRVVN
jgi:dTDP-4-amino-4,6-dideoxygalactose transaminase